MKVAPNITEDDAFLPASWRVVTALLTRSTLTQAELRDATGLSHPVIVQQVSALRAQELVISGPPLYGRPGRPRTPLTFNWQFRRVLVVDVHPLGFTARAMDLAGMPLGPLRTTAPGAWEPEGLRKGLERLIARMLREPGAPWAGIGIALPGSVSPDGQTLLTCAGMPGCAPDPLAEKLATRFSLPVVLESETNALAYSAWSRQPSSPERLMAMSLRHGPRVGLGLLIDGQRVPGIVAECAGLASVRVYANGAAEKVGAAPCLHALLSAAHEDASLRPQAIAALGTISAPLVTALTPHYLGLQGDASWTEDDTARFQHALAAHASPAVMGGLALETHPATPDACLDGIAGMLINRLLDFRQGVIASWLTAM